MFKEASLANGRCQGDANIPTDGKGLEEERRLDISRHAILKRLLT